MIDWTDCAFVVCRDGYIGGRPALRDDPRVPPEVIIDNMDAGDSARDVVEAYALKTGISDVQAIYDFAMRRRDMVK